VPTALPPVNTAPATAPAPAPIAVFLSWFDMPAQAVKPSTNVIAAVCITNFFIVFMWCNSLIKTIKHQKTSVPVASTAIHSLALRAPAS
jgi:hypothetical protein